MYLMVKAYLNQVIPERMASSLAQGQGNLFYYHNQPFNKGVLLQNLNLSYNFYKLFHTLICKILIIFSKHYYASLKGTCYKEKTGKFNDRITKFEFLP